MQSLIICSAMADAAAAAQIRSYIEANCSFISVQEDSIVQSSTELLDAIDHALSADIVVLLISPDVIRRVWSRPQWEPVLIAQPRELRTALGFALLRPCFFPEVLRRQHFFDLASDWRTGIGQLRHWLIEQNPLKQERADLLPSRQENRDVETARIEELERQIGDRPGTATDVPHQVAVAFAHAHCLSFEGVFWIDCSGRSQIGVLGDTAHAVGLKLTGTEAQNRAALHEFCAGPRNLFVFDDLPPEYRQSVNFEGRASVIFTAGSESLNQALALAETVEILANWRKEPARCLGHLRDA